MNISFICCLFININALVALYYNRYEEYAVYNKYSVIEIRHSNKMRITLKLKSFLTYFICCYNVYSHPYQIRICFAEE